jgi:rSAM/selenodomain-associated transferase 2
MMRISVIIPTLNEANHIGPLLSQLRSQKAFELIVCDGGSYDETVSIARSQGAITIQCRPGRAVQLSTGSANATGHALFFLHADTVLPNNALELIARTLTIAPSASGSFCLAFAHNHPILQFYATCSRINSSWTTYGDQGLFMTRQTYDKIGGYRDLALLEDIDIQKRARRYGRFVKLPESLITSPRRFLRDGIIMRQILNILIVCGYACGVSVPFLARFYRPHVRGG